jgi:multidrug efflux pump subunit AcrB
MSHVKSDAEFIRSTHNTARYFTQHRHVAWVLLVGTILWGVFGYVTMPKRKDPEIPVRVAVALASWPGASAEMVEARVTQRVEEELSQNSKIEKLESTTRAGSAVITITLDQKVRDTAGEFDDIWLKLSNLRSLPQGASVSFVKDFGDTSALLLSVASPRSSEVEVALRARQLRRAIEEARAEVAVEGLGERVTLVACFPFTLDASDLRAVGAELSAWAESRGAQRVRLLSGDGFLAIDTQTVASDQKILENALAFARERLRGGELHPDIWRLAVIRDPAQTEERLAAVAGDKYSYRDLDEYSDEIVKALQGLPEVAKVTRSGTVADVVFLDYSQERLASYGVVPAQIEQALSARNIVARGGVMDLEDKSVLIAPAGEIQNEAELAGVIVTRSASGAPVYLRDVASISRGYETPGYLAFSTWRDRQGNWQRTRAVTISLTMRSGLMIADFGAAVNRRVDAIRQLLPEDLVIQRVSDQPEQVRENVDLFMSSLYEAIGLVVLVALIGFWEWRTALLMALSVPITLAMTFGMMRLLGIDVQQVSIASLIIALGLLVDDPVVAADAIKRDLGRGLPRQIATWLGPTKLASAILFATITNIVAYLPFLTLTGDTGRFIYTLPIVLTCSLVASRLVSMTFIPLLAYYLLRAPKVAEPTIEQRRSHGFARAYYRFVGGAIRRRWLSLAVAALAFAGGIVALGGVKQAFFPKDLSYLSYIDVWLPEDAPLATTRETVEHVEAVVRETADRFAAEHAQGGEPQPILDSLTTFVGGGGPRFWFSVAPEQHQANYAQVVVKLKDKHTTLNFVSPLQDALSLGIPGARVDVRELESGPAIGIPVSLRVSGEDPATLREIAAKLQALLKKTPSAERVRDSWGTDNLSLRLRVGPDRANFAGVTNLDVSRSSATALNGSVVGEIYEGDHRLPIVTRLKASERERLSDLPNLYVYGSGGERVPLRQIADLDYTGTTAKILRRNHVRTITVGAFPVSGALPSQVLAEIGPELDEIRAELPPGYDITIGGEQEEQVKSFLELVIVLAISVLAIYTALVLQFRNAVKPLIVFAAIPFGVVGSLLSLRLMNAPFGFMAFLGVISLIGVIVSHVIVLFDYIEEQRLEGEPLMMALLDAGILRLRPVLVTVGATVLGLFPLAAHGGPLWEPLCYVQIGGLTLATVITLVLVPVLYATFVLDLKWVQWEEPPAGDGTSDPHAPPASGDAPPAAA